MKWNNINKGLNFIHAILSILVSSNQAFVYHKVLLLIKMSRAWWYICTDLHKVLIFVKTVYIRDVLLV